MRLSFLMPSHFVNIQAALLGEYLADETFTRAYASDYQRTTETAQIILSKSKNSSNLELKKDERLRERVSIFSIGITLYLLFTKNLLLYF